MSFYSEQPIKAIRKARACDGCGSALIVGEPALKCSGNHDGFWSGAYHHECREAECALNKLHDIWGGDDWMSLCSDMEWDDYPWLIAEHPVVAERMKITTERYEKIRDEHERCRAAWAEIDRKRRESKATGERDHG